MHTRQAQPLQAQPAVLLCQAEEAAPPATAIPAQPNRPRRSTLPLTPPGDLPAEEGWEQFFSTHQPHPGDVADLVLRLHQKKDPAGVVACLEAALRNGQGQPWMYTVLALEMEAAGRPAADVQRVLLSLVDSQIDAPNLLYTAAFLTRYGAKDRALALYQQAALADPTRLEPYVLGLRLACQLRDVDGAIWGVTGQLQRAWQKGYEQQHRAAVAQTDALEQQLRDAGETAEAERLARAVRQARQRDLFVELTWSGVADLDLIVEEPGGSICSFDSPQTPGGGILAADGHGANQADSLDRYVCPQGLPGDYTVRVRYNVGNVVGKRAVLRIVRYQGTPYEMEDRHSIELGPEDQLLRVSLNRGRRQELGWIPLVAPQDRERRSGRGGREERDRERDALTGLGDRNRRLARGGAGYQPVITILPDGISNTALAVVSADRRYVRLSMTPLFSTIRDVFTYSFLTGGGGGAGGGGGGAGGGGGGAGGGGGGAGTGVNR